MCRTRVCTGALALVLGVVTSASAELVGHWAFDEGQGTTAYDSSGNDYHGTLQGDPQWATGKINGALEFDGTGDYVEVPDNESLHLWERFTLAAWIYQMESRSSRIIDKIGAGTANGPHLDTHPGTTLRSCSGTCISTAIDYTLNEWHHVAVTFDAGSVKLYIDGAVQGQGDVPSPLAGNDLSLRIGAASDGGSLFVGLIDDAAVFDHALTEAEILAAMEGIGSTELAAGPSPDDAAVDVPRDVILGWEPGEFAVTHDVYLGTAFEDVNDASRSNPLDVLVSQGQSDAAYTPDAVLTFGQTYYWRIDEVNAAPDNTIFKGEVWSFTVEPLAYPIAGVVATSNGVSDPGVGPDRTVDGSGLNADDQHSTTAADMWLATQGAEPLQIQYEFDRIYKLHEMLVWNYNVQFELILGFGIKDATVEYSANGADWTVLGDVVIAQATARDDYAANTAIDFGGAAAQAVRLTVNAGYGMMGQFGLSEVRFMFIPAQARQPQPADGAADVDVDTALSWRAGREAVTHDLSLGTDPEALALIDSVTETTVIPADLQFGSTYYWRIDEVNEADEVTVWQGNLWSFATQAFAVIDDFESYDDEDNRIFDTWLDGFVNETGATVGYFNAPFAEQTVVNSGSQSMPLEYANDAAPFYSEAEFDLGSLNLNGNGADTLRLFVAGQAPAFLENTDGTILMNAVGADIWDAADQFRYAYKSLTGDGSMVARVDALDATPSTWAKAGVMIRQNDAVGSTHSLMCLTGGDGNGASWQGRTSENAASVNNDATSAVAPPYWVRIDRAGDTLTGYLSPDGQDWTQLGDARSISMTDPVLIGLALTSHNVDMATSAEFSNVSFTGNVSGDWQVAEIGVAQPEGNIPESIYVALEDANGNVAVVTSQPGATARSGWTEWLIPYTDLAGVNLSRVATLAIGIGDRDNPTAGGTGTIFIDDIAYGHPAAE